MTYIRHLNSITAEAVSRLDGIIGPPPPFEAFLQELRDQIAKSAAYADAIHSYGSSSSQARKISTELAEIRDRLEDLKVQLNVCRA